MGVFRRSRRTRFAALAAAAALAGCAHSAPASGPETTSPAPAPAAVVNAQSQPTASDAAADSLLMDVRAVDSTIRVEARYAGRHNFTGAPLPGYEANRAFLRREAAVALKLFDGYRPVRATLAMVAWAERTGQTHLLDDGYIARRSRHNQGVAVDLTLVELESGFELDLGTPFDTFSAAAHTANASGRAARYRQLLVKVMEEEGFKNYDQEWWHFTYDVPNPVPFDRVIR